MRWRLEQRINTLGSQLAAAVSSTAWVCSLSVVLLGREISLPRGYAPLAPSRGPHRRSIARGGSGYVGRCCSSALHRRIVPNSATAPWTAEEAGGPSWLSKNTQRRFIIPPRPPLPVSSRENTLRTPLAVESEGSGLESTSSKFKPTRHTCELGWRRNGSNNNSDGTANAYVSCRHLRRSD